MRVLNLNGLQQISHQPGDTKNNIKQNNIYQLTESHKKQTNKKSFITFLFSKVLETTGYSYVLQN